VFLRCLWFDIWPWSRAGHSKLEKPIWKNLFDSVFLRQMCCLQYCMLNWAPWTWLLLHTLLFVIGTINCTWHSNDDYAEICNIQWECTVRSDGTAVYGKPISELQSITCHIGSHCITCHQTRVNVPCHSPSWKDLIYLPQRDGRLSWPWCWLQTGMVYQFPVMCTSTNLLIATWPGVEPTTSWLQIQRPNGYTTRPPK